MRQKAAFFETVDAATIRCGLCPGNCKIELGGFGDCLSRQNIENQLEVTTYGRLVATALDPIEKKPLYHYRPGTTTLSIASSGCNLDCPFCQNHGISQELRRSTSEHRLGQSHTPTEIVEAAKRAGAQSISFTYSEPILQFEFARDIAEIAAQAEIELVFVTNGQASSQAAVAIAKIIHAANVDLKCFSKMSYKNVLGGSLKATLRTIETFARSGLWVEVTTLVIPDFNDSDEELIKIAKYIADVNPKIPWHVSRFHPAYQWTNRNHTSSKTLQRARMIGMDAGLAYVYTGNLPGDEGEKTYCPSCGVVCIDRQDYRIVGVATSNGRCVNCGEEIAGVGIS
jgi:pyruvate formate lyase activating enzyme